MSFTSGRTRWSDVYLAAAVRAISSCGNFLAATTLALGLHQSGEGGLAVSGLLLAASLPVVLLAPLTGRLVDRVDSRTLLIAAGLGQAGVCAVLAAVGHPLSIIGLVALLACGLAVTHPTLAALLPEMVRRDDLAKASGINQTASMTGMLLAPALAGVLVGQFGVRPPLLLAAVAFLALALVGPLLRTRRGGRVEPSGGPSTDRVAPAWRLRDDRLVSAMVIAIAAVVGGVGAVNVIEVFFIRDTLDASTTVFGFVSAAWTAGMVLGALLFGRLGHRWAEPGAQVYAVLLLLGGACAAVLAGSAVPAALLLVPLWLVGGVCNGGLNVFTNVLVANRVPAADRGRAFALMQAAVQGAGMVGFLLGGLLVDRIEPRPLVAAAGLAGLLIVLLLVPAVRRTVRRERPAGTPPGRGARLATSEAGA